MRNLWGILAMIAMSCGPSRASTTPGDHPPALPTTTFAEDLTFLQKHGPVHVLQSPSGARVAVSAKYQGRVMTSAVEPTARSLGWVFRKFIEEGKTDTQFDNYGGEDRFWLGPEGGQFSLYFPKGMPFKFEHWQTPAAFQSGQWDVVSSDASSITLEHQMKLVNYAGTEFQIKVVRTVRLLSSEDASKRLQVPISAVNSVAFETVNRITNIGNEPWTEDKGLVSIWILAMFPPTPDTFVVVPFDTHASGPIVNDTYFGKVPADRLQVHEKEGFLVFRCDGKYRSKIGLGPARALPVLGSYSPSARLLSIVQYTKPAGASRYVNSMWEIQKEPFGGDVVNSYNDGPTEPGKPPLGGFYEMESSSPGAALAPGAELIHTHATFHFVGGQRELDAIALPVLHTNVSSIAPAQTAP